MLAIYDLTLRIRTVPCSQLGEQGTFFGLMRLGPPHKFCVHACMTPVFSGRTKLGICLPNLTTRGGEVCPFFVAEQRKGERKSAKGFNTPWHPAVRHEKLKLF